MFRFFKEPTFASPSPSYYSSGENFKCMHVLYCGVTWEEAALVEAVLIESHLSKPSNPNVRPRGEGRQVGAGPFFTYVVFKPAMWRTRFGLQKKIHELHFDSCSCIQPYMIYITVYFPQMMSNSSCFLPTSWLAPCSLHLFATEVPCSQVIGFAKKALADSSGTASGVTSCPVVRTFGKSQAQQKGWGTGSPPFQRAFTQPSHRAHASWWGVVGWVSQTQTDRLLYTTTWQALGIWTGV